MTFYVHDVLLRKMITTTWIHCFNEKLLNEKNTDIIQDNVKSKEQKIAYYTG